MQKVLCFPLGLAMGLAVSLGAAGEAVQPFVPQVELSRDAVGALPPSYVPAQTVAAFPERLLPSYENIAVGIKELAPDIWSPVDGGLALLPGKKGAYAIHHRRAGVTCHDDLTFQFRLELARDLASLRLALQKGDGPVVPFGTLSRKSFTCYPGRVVYELEDSKLQLAATVEVVAPAVTPAYGFLARVSLVNLSSDEVEVKLLALGAPGSSAPQTLAADPAGRDFLQLSCPRDPAAISARIPFDPNLSVLVGWDGGAASGATANAATRGIRLMPHGKTTAHLTAILDSPGFDEPAVRSQIEAFFSRHQEIAEAVRKRMTEEALDTFARILVEGDRRFAEVRNDEGKSLSQNLAAWANGVYREAPVRFELSDKKLESLANIVANDFFPGIVQPPGIVHDAKKGDVWNYIFSYRHVHAASNIALEGRALDYLNLLSLNRKSDGRIDSVLADFKSIAHPTRFEESYIDSLWHYYKWTGDLDAVRRLWPTLTGAAVWMDKTLDPDGDHLYKDTLHQWKSDFDSRGPSSAFQTALVRRTYSDLAELAEKLGKADEAQKFKAKADAIRAAAIKELWSNEFGVLGSKCPLGLLRLHPQCLDVDIPIWTGLLSPEQSVMMADWYLNNASFADKQGGLYFYDNNWWPIVWSTHMPAQGNMMMSAWGLMLSGRHEEGTRVLATAAAIAYRSASPGFDYIFTSNGTSGLGHEPATCQGAFLRALVEGLFGVTPNLDDRRIVIQPRFPDAWNHARFIRPGLDVNWERNDAEQTFTVTTEKDVIVRFQIPLNTAVRSVTLDGKPVHVELTSAMCRALLNVETGNGGGVVKVVSEPRSWRIDAPAELEAGQSAELKLSGLSRYELQDPYGFFDVTDKAPDRAVVRLKRSGAGQATLFVHCTLAGGVSWVEPLTFITLPRSVKESTSRTVADPVPAGARLVPVDLAAAYNDSIQSCFLHRWQMDAYDNVSDKISYWTMPLFQLTEPLPRNVTVGEIPFLLGDMEQDMNAKNLIMLINTPPRELATTAVMQIDGRKLHKFYLLSLNMNMPMKSYVPAASVTVMYSDGTRQVTELIPPVNFDSYYQDFAVNTMALPLESAAPAHGQDKWVGYYGTQCDRMHLTMTDVICDPAKKVQAIEFRSVATETFMGIAGITLLEAESASAPAAL